MAQNKARSLIWQRKHKNSENIQDGIRNIVKALFISLSVLTAFFITVILTFHIELSLLFRNIFYGEPIVIKKPISIVRKIPVFHQDSLSNSPLSVEIETQSPLLQDHSQDAAIPPSPTSDPDVKQVGSYTFQVRIGSDDRMATPREIFDALNEYRHQKGKGSLQWNDTLADYALTRAQYFSNNQILDEHEGFRQFVNNEDGFEVLGFNSLGENSAYLSGGALMGKNIIQQLFASDIYHDNNQLDTKWTHVGVGIDNLAINVIFGGKKINE